MSARAPISRAFKRGIPRYIGGAAAVKIGSVMLSSPLLSSPPGVITSRVASFRASRALRLCAMHVDATLGGVLAISASGWQPAGRQAR